MMKRFFVFLFENELLEIENDSSIIFQCLVEEEDSCQDGFLTLSFLPSSASVCINLTPLRKTKSQNNWRRNRWDDEEGNDPSSLIERRNFHILCYRHQLHFFRTLQTTCLSILLLYMVTLEVSTDMSRSFYARLRIREKWKFLHERDLHRDEVFSILSSCKLRHSWLVMKFLSSPHKPAANRFSFVLQMNGVKCILCRSTKNVFTLVLRRRWQWWWIWARL